MTLYCVHFIVMDAERVDFTNGYACNHEDDKIEKTKLYKFVTYSAWCFAQIAIVLNFYYALYFVQLIEPITILSISESLI